MQEPKCAIAAWVGRLRCDWEEDSRLLDLKRSGQLAVAWRLRRPAQHVGLEETPALQGVLQSRVRFDA